MTSYLRNHRRDRSRSPKCAKDYKSNIHRTNDSSSSPRVQRTGRHDRKRSRERSSDHDSRKYDNCVENRSRRKHSSSPEKRKRTKPSSRHQSPNDAKRDDKENRRTGRDSLEISYRGERCRQNKTTYDRHKKHIPCEGHHKKHKSPSSKSKEENETNKDGDKVTLTSSHNPEKSHEASEQSSDGDESIDLLDAALSTQSTDKKVLDLGALGAKSEKRIRKHNLVPLPDSDSFYFERQKERYYANMHKLIVTARSQIQSLEQKIEVLNKRQEAHSTLKCPQCTHQFSTGPNRLLPKYVRVLQSTNRVELQFESLDSIKNWLIAYDLDRDAKGIPCFISETKPKGQLTLADVKSTLMNVKLQKEAY
ncbi:hypothetical protein Ddc_00307 [Ditylenchus destructor]|nr:hypothetical protein Ddc_00307 [Ditylenchus destructor]